MVILKKVSQTIVTILRHAKKSFCNFFNLFNQLKLSLQINFEVKLKKRKILKSGIGLMIIQLLPVLKKIPKFS